jgi:hypothetical protein
MRLNSLLAIAATAIGLVTLSPAPADATEYRSLNWRVDRQDVPPGWGNVREVRHWFYYPRYHNHYLTHGQTDPFAYESDPRGYYPYYNSGYWKPRHAIRNERAHFVKPKYFKAWGANKAHWDHATWLALHPTPRTRRGDR